MTSEEMARKLWEKWAVDGKATSTAFVQMVAAAIDAAVAEERNKVAVLQAECEAWRAAWDGRDDMYGDRDRPYRDPRHGHQVPAIWDDGAIPCESCQRFLMVGKARAATDALAAAGLEVQRGE